MLRRRSRSPLQSMGITRSWRTFSRQLRFFTIESTQPLPAFPWTRPPRRRFTAVICRRRSSPSSGIRTAHFRTEFPRWTFHTIRLTYRSRRPCISPTLPLAPFLQMLLWKAPATRPEIGTFWCISNPAAGTTPRFTRCGRESTKGAPGQILQTHFGPTHRRMP